MKLLSLLGVFKIVSYQAEYGDCSGCIYNKNKCNGKTNCAANQGEQEVEWDDEDGKRQRTYVALRGPVETKIDYIQKHGISVDNPNYSLNILMPKTTANLK